MNLFYSPIIFILTVVYSSYALSATTMQVPLSDGSDLEVKVYSPDKKNISNNLLLILPSGHGITDGLQALASQLQNTGVETWVADPFTTWLLPELESSVNGIPIEAYVELISHAKKTGKNIYLLSNDSGVRLALNAAHQWQTQFKGIISGVILISPNLYIHTPTVGNDGLLFPIAYGSNLPIYIFMPAKSTLALRINETVSALQQGGSDVYTQVLREVRNRFFFRPDASTEEVQVSSVLNKKIAQSFMLMESYAGVRVAPKLKKLIDKAVKETGQLLRYKTPLTPKNFTLKDISDNDHSLNQYKGKVVLVNFWASWCPPCIHEMPSMSLLNSAYDDADFTILAINLGEPPEAIKQFIKTYPVNFTVLLDPLKQLPKQWKVFAYPTSFLLDKKGDIRYSVAGGIEWGTDDVKVIIDKLVAE